MGSYYKNTDNINVFIHSTFLISFLPYSSPPALTNYVIPTAAAYLSATTVNKWPYLSPC